MDKNFKPKIEIVVNLKSKEISLTDNGPGIPPEKREEVFQPFVTTKSAGEGKGLGLFISKEVANYNDAELYLSDLPNGESDNLNTFIFQLEAKDQ